MVKRYKAFRYAKDWACWVCWHRHRKDKYKLKDKHKKHLEAFWEEF